MINFMVGLLFALIFCLNSGAFGYVPSGDACPASEVVFIDPSVRDAEIIVAQLPQGAEVVRLSPGMDAVGQISAHLAKKRGLSAIRIISHGNAGYFVLNGKRIDESTLRDRVHEIRSWKGALADHCDILLYACNLGDGAGGRRFVETLGGLTGADVSASTNLTGKGGDWNLEYARGGIQSAAIKASGYPHHLEATTYTVTSITSAGGTTYTEGELNWAINQSNLSTDDDDTIAFNLTSGSTVTISAALTAITDTVTIDGNIDDDTNVKITTSGDTPNTFTLAGTSVVTFNRITINSPAEIAIIDNSSGLLTLSNVTLGANVDANGGTGGVTTTGALTLAAPEGTEVTEVKINTDYGGGADITFGGDVTGNLTLSAMAANADIYFNSTVGAETALSGLTVWAAAHLFFGDTVEVNGDIDITADAINVQAGTFNSTSAAGTWYISGAVTIASGATLNATSGTFNVGGNWSNSGTFTSGTNTNTVTFDGTSGTKTITSGGDSFNNITFNDGGNDATFELEDALDVNGNLTITGGILDTKDGENNAISVAGNWSNSDTFTARSGIVTFDGSGSSTISGTTTFNNLTCATAGKTLTFTTGVTQTIATLNLTGTSENLITINSNSSGTKANIIVTDSTVSFVSVQDSNNTGTDISTTSSTDGGNNWGWSFGPSTMTWDGSTDSDWSDGTNWDTGTAPTANDNVVIANAGRAPILVAGITVINLTINIGASLDVSSGNNYSVSLTGNWANNGTFTARAGTVTFSGTAAQTITGRTTVYNITVNNTHAADKVDASGGTSLAVNNNLTVTDGIFKSASDYTNISIAAAGTLELSGNITVSGNWSNSGTFTPGTHKVTLDGTGQTLSGATSFYDLTKNVTSADTLTFQSGSANKTTITNTLDLQGESGKLLSLRSSPTDTQWEIDPKGTRTIAYLDVKDSKNVNATTIDASDSVDSGNNTKWSFATKVDLTGPATVTAGAVSTVFTLTSQDAGGDASNVTADTKFDLSSNSSGTKVFYSNAAGTSVITQTTIANGSSTAAFYYKDSAKGTPTLTAAWNSGGTDLGSDTLQVTVDLAEATLATSSSVASTFKDFKVTVTKIQMYNGTSWVEIFSGAAELDLVNGGTFPGISDVALPSGTYSRMEVTFRNSLPVTGTLTYSGTPYYTTAATFGGDSNIAGNPSNDSGSQTVFTFRIEDWGAVGTDVEKTFDITPITVGATTDYQPTLRFTIRQTFLFKGSAGTELTYYFALSAPTVSIVEP